MYKILYSKQAEKDMKKLKQAGLTHKAKPLIGILKANPLQYPPPYKRLMGDLEGYISRRINIQHRLVYKILENKKIIKIYRMWTHYE
jgi:Txe/YoeB family toxin of toxin-antitoxin system